MKRNFEVLEAAPGIKSLLKIPEANPIKIFCLRKDYISHLYIAVGSIFIAIVKFMLPTKCFQ